MVDIFKGLLDQQSKENARIKDQQRAEAEGRDKQQQYDEAWDRAFSLVAKDILALGKMLDTDRLSEVIASLSGPGLYSSNPKPKRYLAELLRLGCEPETTEDELTDRIADALKMWSDDLLRAHLRDVMNRIHPLCISGEELDELAARQQVASGSVLTKPRRKTALPQAVEPPDPESYLSCVNLAERFGIDADSLRKRLERWRGKNCDGWIENSNPGHKEAIYTYRVGSVMQIIDDLKK